MHAWFPDIVGHTRLPTHGTLPPITTWKIKWVYIITISYVTQEMKHDTDLQNLLIFSIFIRLLVTTNCTWGYYRLSESLQRSGPIPSTLGTTALLIIVFITLFQQLPATSGECCSTFQLIAGLTRAVTRYYTTVYGNVYLSHVRVTATCSVCSSPRRFKPIVFTERAFCFTYFVHSSLIPPFVTLLRN